MRSQAPVSALIHSLILAMIAILPVLTLGGCRPALDRGEPSRPPSLHPGWTTFTNTDRVSDLAVDHEGKIWAVGPGGAVRWNPSDGTYTHYTVDHGLPANHIRSVAVAPAPPDSDWAATLWFGTNGSGLARYRLPRPGGEAGDPAERWTTFTTEDGLVDNTVSAIAVAAAPPAPSGGRSDTRVAMWIGTPQGVSRYVEPAPGAPASSAWTTYTEQDGLAHNYVRDIAVEPAPAGSARLPQSSEPVQSASAVLARGRTSVGSARLIQSSKPPSRGRTSADSTQALGATLWFATDDGVSRYLDPATSPGAGAGWTTYTEEDGLAGNRVRVVIVDPATAGSTGAAVWFGSHGGGVSRLAEDRWTRFTFDDGLTSDEVQALAVDAGGVVWVGTPHGVSRYDGASWTRVGEGSELAHDDVRAIAVTKTSGGASGDLWFGTWGGSVSRLQDDTWATYRTKGPAGNSVHSIAIGPAGSVWLGARDGGVSLYRGQSRDGGETWVTYTAKDGLAGNDVRSLAIASAPPRGIDAPPSGSAVVWAGTWNGGASRFDGETWTTFTTSDGLAGNSVSSIAVDPEGSIWFGTFGWGVSRLNDGTWTTFTEEDGLAQNLVQSVLVTAAPTATAAPTDGTRGTRGTRATVWAGTDEEGLSRSSGPVGGAGKAVTWHTYTFREGLARNNVRCMAAVPPPPGEAGFAGLWIGTYNGGASMFDGTSWTSYGIANGLADPDIYAIAVEPGGPVWFATFDSGVFRFDGDESWTHLTMADGLASNAVRAVAVAEDGTLWLGYDGAGVSRYVPPD